MIWNISITVINNHTSSIYEFWSNIFSCPACMHLAEDDNFTTDNNCISFHLCRPSWSWNMYCYLLSYLSAFEDACHVRRRTTIICHCGIEYTWRRFVLYCLVIRHGNIALAIAMSTSYIDWCCSCCILGTHFALELLTLCQFN
jgi:hypothetical protein